MTVSSQTSTATFVGNGVATAFPLPFRFFDNGDIRAYFIDSVTGAATQMVLGSDYTLIGAGEPEVDGSALSLLTATSPLASMRGLYVERVMPQVQETDIVNQGEFFASTHEDVFDRLTMLIQQSNSNSQGAIRVAIGDPEPTRLVPAVSRANMLLGFDSSGNPIAVAPVSGSASDLAMDLANSADPAKGAGMIGWMKQAVGAVATTVGKWLSRKTEIDVFDFMTDAQIADVKGAHALDHTAALTAAVTAAFSSLPAKVVLGKGQFNFSSLPNLAKSGLTIEGAGLTATVLQFTGTGIALNFDAFESGNPADPFIQNCNLVGLTVKGTATTTRLVSVQGLARCHWRDVNVCEAEPTAGYGFHFRGFMLSKFDRLMCSTDLQAMASVPRTGIYVDDGRRAGVSVGNSSNNTFNNCYFEGLPIGGSLFRADQNVFNGGAFESCSVYGLVVNTASRYNSFFGVGFENLGATADVADGGIFSHFSNCYASQSFLLQGRQCRVNGGYFERIEIQGGASNNSVRDVTVNHWATGAGGFFDSGVATRNSRIYDADIGSFVYKKAARSSITVTASPFTFTNNAGVTCSVIIQAGTITQVRIGDGSGDLWLTSAATPNTHVLRPGDVIEVSYSVAPDMSRIISNEI